MEHNRLRAEPVAEDDVSGQWRYRCHTEDTDRDWDILIERLPTYTMGETTRTLYVWTVTCPGQPTIQARDDGDFRESRGDAVRAALIALDQQDQLRNS